ncbi:MAG: hypothetical protein R3F62_26880 [Planctomycetota bacterium]
MNQRLQRNWRLCQSGVRLCREDSNHREKVLMWLERQGDPLSKRWIDILMGDRPDLLEFLLDTAEFPGTGEWRQLITSSPFRFDRFHKRSA